MMDILKDISKLPWQVIGDDESGDGCKFIQLESVDPCDAICEVHGDYGNEDDIGGLDGKPRANAAYIVHACNNYPALVEALKAFCEPWEPGRNDLCNETRIKNARAALAKAGEQS